jgi:hypothetical protein
MNFYVGGPYGYLIDGAGAVAVIKIPQWKMTDGKKATKVVIMAAVGRLTDGYRGGGLKVISEPSERSADRSPVGAATPVPTP